jgi:acetyltransferase-like isoleucine patch superfamily enzyme
VSVGDNVILWSGNHVGHRTRIADHCFIASHVVISGYCSIGEHTFMGVNSCVGDGLTIGEDAVVGAGAVVVRDLDARGVYVGNPAKATGRDAFDTFGVK